MAESDASLFSRLRQAHPAFAQATSSALAFAQLLRDRQPQQLKPWLRRAAQSSLAAFRRLEKSFRRDYAVIKAGAIFSTFVCTPLILHRFGKMLNFFPEGAECRLDLSLRHNSWEREALAPFSRAFREPLLNSDRCQTKQRPYSSHQPRPLAGSGDDLQKKTHGLHFRRYGIDTSCHVA